MSMKKQPMRPPVLPFSRVGNGIIKVVGSIHTIYTWIKNQHRQVLNRLQRLNDLTPQRAENLSNGKKERIGKCSLHVCLYI